MVEIPRTPDSLRLRQNIRLELASQRAIAGLDLDDSVLDGLAESIAANIEYGFEIRWSPQWVKEGDPNRWEEGANEQTKYFVECLHCNRVTVHHTKSDADAWWAAHRQDHR